MTDLRQTTRQLLMSGLFLLAACGRGKEAEEQTAAPTPASEGTPPTASAPAPRPDPTQAPVDPQFASLETLRGLPRSPESEIAIGNIFLNRGESDSALVHYREATRLDPKNLAALNYAGIALSRLGRFAEARAAYEKAIEMDAFYIHTNINLGNLYLKQDAFDLAAKQYRIATSIDSTNAGAWLNLGLAYERLKDVNRAILAYNKAEQCDPRDPTALERLGWIYYDRMFYDAARDRWRKAVARDPSRQDLIDNIARLQAYSDSLGIR